MTATKTGDAQFDQLALTAQEAIDALVVMTAQRDELLAEIKRRDAFRSCDGCSTGDCPHDKTSQCIAAQGEQIAEMAAEEVRLQDQRDELLEVCKLGETSLIALVSRLQSLRAALASAAKGGAA